MTNADAKKRAPDRRFKSGLCQVSIWEHRNDDGKTHFSLKFTRSYTTDGGKSWLRTDSFGARELKRVAFLALQADDHIAARYRELKREQDENGEPEQPPSE